MPYCGNRNSNKFDDSYVRSCTLLVGVIRITTVLFYMLVCSRLILTRQLFVFLQLSRRHVYCITRKLIYLSQQFIYTVYIGWCFLLIVAAASHIYHGRDDKSSIPPIDSRERDCVYLYTHSTRHVELHTAVMRAIYIPYAFVLCRDM